MSGDKTTSLIFKKKKTSHTTFVALLLSSSKIELASRVQIVGEAVCILHSANILGNGTNPIILPSSTAMCK